MLLVLAALLLAPHAASFAVDLCEKQGPCGQSLALRTTLENLESDDVTWTLTSTDCPEEATLMGGPELYGSARATDTPTVELTIATNLCVGRQYTFQIRGLGYDAQQSFLSLWMYTTTWPSRAPTAAGAGPSRSRLMFRSTKPPPSRRRRRPGRRRPRRRGPTTRETSRRRGRRVPLI